MYTKQEYLKSLSTNASSFLTKIDKDLRKGIRTVDLGWLDNDEYTAITEEIIQTLEKAGWKCKIHRSTYKVDEGKVYINIK